MRSAIEVKPAAGGCGTLCLLPTVPTGTTYSDFWGAYQAVREDEQHQAVGKETGETAHVERWNHTLRQRLGRFVRKTLSFPSHGSCTKSVSACVCIATTWRSPSSEVEPLPFNHNNVVGMLIYACNAYAVIKNCALFALWGMKKLKLEPVRSLTQAAPKPTIKAVRKITG
jgi:IS1 transposase